MSDTNLKNDATGRHGESIIELARVLYDKMEHLDPGSCGGLSWDDLPARDVEYYVLCVESLIERRSLIRRAMSDDDVILGQAELGV